MAACCVLALVGCVKYDDHLIARPQQPPVTPEGVGQIEHADIYDIPKLRDDVGMPVRNVPRPRSLAGDMANTKIKLHRLEDELWVSVAMPPESAWAVVELFIISRGGISNVRPKSGVLVSVPRDGVVEQFRIERGLQALASEIFLQLTTESGTPIADQRAKQELVLRDLVAYLSEAPTTSPRASLLAQNIKSPQKARLLPGTPPRFFIYLGFPRAWSVLERALSSLPWNIVDRNRTQGQFDIEVEGDKRLLRPDIPRREFSLTLYKRRAGYEILVSGKDMDAEQVNEVLQAVYRQLN